MRSVFLATGAYLGRIDGETRVAFWADEPTGHGFDPTRLITIDLALTPSAAAAGEISWDAVQVDDCFNTAGGAVGGTTLGPAWPEVQLAGAVYLEREFWRSLPESVRPTCPPKRMDGQIHEFMSVVYWPHMDDPRAGRRYVGHHAEIVEERGSLGRVRVFSPGTSTRATTQSFPMWIDFDSSEMCDSGSESLTLIGVGSRPKQGALFLTSAGMSKLCANSAA